MYTVMDSEWSTKAIQNLFEKTMDIVISYGVKIILALLFIWLGYKLTNILVKALKKRMEIHGIDKSVTGFLASLISIVLKVVILLTAANGLGVKVTSFLTILGSVGVAAGLAVQGSLANLAGGVLILILKPYRVGDYIKTEGNCEGTVIAIDIFYTRLRSIDNQTIVIPNGTLSNGSITNVTKEDVRRIDLLVGVAYDTDIKKAKAVLEQVARSQESILIEKGINVFVNELADSGIILGIHAWVVTEQYWQTRWDLLEQIKYAFDENEIEIPYNTVDVNVIHDK